MPELDFMPVTKAFNLIGARTASGGLYETVRGKSMSADKRHFRFWEDEVYFHDEYSLELYRPAPPPHRTWYTKPRGRAFYAALVEAHESASTIYVMINRRGKRDKDDNSVATEAAPVLTSAGDPAPGRVLYVDPVSGVARVRLSLSVNAEDASFFTDQFDTFESPVSRTEIHSTRFSRDPAVRFRVFERANGVCERPSCRARGFETFSGIYIETHHVIPLSEGGPDSTANVVALCPNCHRMAHYCVQRDSIRNELIEWLLHIHDGA